WSRHRSGRRRVVIAFEGGGEVIRRGAGLRTVFLSERSDKPAVVDDLASPCGLCLQHGMGEAEMEGVRDQLLMDGQRNVGGPQQQQQQCTTCTLTAAAAAAELSFLKPAGFIQHKMRSSDSRARDGGLAREEGRGSMGGSSKRRRRGSSARTLAAGLVLTLAACSTPAYGFMVPAGAGGADPITGAAAAVAAGQHRQQQQQQQQQFSRG
ncbi:unnamed protein product, partial [Ectocarpus sp. 13 AM-2016]